MGRYEAWERVYQPICTLAIRKRKRNLHGASDASGTGKEGLPHLSVMVRGDGRAFVLYDCRGGGHTRVGKRVVLLLLAASAMKSKEWDTRIDLLFPLVRHEVQHCFPFHHLHSRCCSPPCRARVSSASHRPRLRMRFSPPMGLRHTTRAPVALFSIPLRPRFLVKYSLIVSSTASFRCPSSSPPLPPSLPPSPPQPPTISLTSSPPFPLPSPTTLHHIPLSSLQNPTLGAHFKPPPPPSSLPHSLAPSLPKPHNQSKARQARQAIHTYIHTAYDCSASVDSASVDSA